MTPRGGGVVVVGHATIDDIRPEGGAPLPGTLGGAAVYATVAAAMSGAHVQLVTRVGDDYPIERLERDARVDVAAVRRTEPRSIHNVAWYAADGSRRFEIEDWAAMERLTPRAEDLADVRLDDAVVLLTPAPLGTQLALVDALAGKRCLVAVDTELHYLRDPGDADLLRTVLGRADLALPSIEHLQALFGCASRDPLDYAGALAELGCTAVAVKQGAAGSTLLDCTGGRHLRLPAVRGVTAVDPTGAGDSYNGGLVAALARGDDLATAARWGTVAAAFMVECVGAARPAAYSPAAALARFAEVSLQPVATIASVITDTRMPVNERDGTPTASALEREIAQQGDLLEQVRAARRDDVEALLERIPSPAVRRWAVIGAGDSLFSGMCAQYWFAEAAGLPLDAHNALAYSRYLYRASDEDSVVFAVSYSGTTVRVVEAARAAKSRGATVVAITANGDSPLVELADAWLPNDAASERSNTRTVSFQATALLLRMVADGIAERLGATGLPALDGIGAAVDALAVSSEAAVSAAVAELPEALTWIVVGGGYGHPVASYGAAKLYEAATLTAHPSELEQFIHCEIFPVTGATCVVLLAPRGASHARAVELAGGLREIGARTVAISDDPGFAAHTERFVALPGGWAESALPFLGVVPLQWLALRVAQRRGENPDLVANKAVNRPLIESPLQWQAADYAVSGDGRVTRA